MDPGSNLYKWADAHVFYNVPLSRPINESLGDRLGYNWQQRLLGAPNGHLLSQNSFFSALTRSNEIYLAHTTYNLAEILKNGFLYPSSGCLVGSLYCTPLASDDKGLRMHNLGRYIHFEEAPKFGCRNDSKKDLNTLVIGISLPEESKHNIIGVDYLRLGNIHLDIYKDLEYLLSSGERFELHKVVVERIKAALEFLSQTNNYFSYPSDLKPDAYIDSYIHATESLPVLGYFYFEVISEYIMLFGDNTEFTRYAKQGEFYNRPYKDFMFSLSPKLFKNFTLKDFKPSLRELINFLNREALFRDLDIDQMKCYIAERLIFLLNARLFNGPTGSITWRKLRWDFEELTNFVRPLIGHLIHRELRTFGRYQNFYFYFDQYKALQIWNYWNHMNVVIPFNGVMPKGEVGINPAYTDLKYKIYSSKFIYKGQDVYLERDKQLRLLIAPKLVDLKFTFMRNKKCDK